LLSVTSTLAVEDLAELGGAWDVGPSLQDRGDARRGHPVPHLCFVAGPSQAVERKATGEVDEGARDGRDRDAAIAGEVGGVEVPRPVRDDTSDAALPDRGDLRCGRTGLDESEQMRGSEPAKRSPVTAGQHGGDVAGLNTRCPVAEAIDAPVLAMEQPHARAPLHPGARQPRLKQLADGNHAVLAAGNPGHLLERWSEFGSHTDP
jgi:hypothetical protein